MAAFESIANFNNNVLLSFASNYDKIIKSNSKVDAST